MIKFSLTMLVMVIMVGCASKKEKDVLVAYQKNNKHYKNLQKTEKLQFIENNVTKIMLTATYVNAHNVNLDDKSDEVFLIGLSGDVPEHVTLKSEDFSIKLLEVLSKKETREALRLEKEKRKLENVKRKKKVKIPKVYLEALSVKSIPRSSPLLKNIAFNSQWSEYYLVHYKHIDGNRLTLQVKREKNVEPVLSDEEQTSTSEKAISYETKTMNFSKVAKYAL